MSVDAVLAGLGSVRDLVERTYRDLHENPELSHLETRTAALVARELGEAGFEVTEAVGGTGVVGRLVNGAGPTVLLRADMDALPVEEQTGLAYASRRRGVDPQGAEVPVMHACAHDMHVAMLLGAARLLAQGRAHWSGTVVALFQPAEELGDGALGMVEDGLAEVVGPLDVALGQHVMPLPAGVVTTRSGPTMAAADSMRVTVFGRGSHGSMPQNGIDPVVMAAMIVVRLQTIVSREVAPTEPAVVTVGSLHAGTKSNIISDRAVLELNVRTYDEGTRTRVLDAIKRIVRAECAASGATREPEFELHAGFPVTDNDPEVTSAVTAAFRERFGDRLQPGELQTGSEDFGVIPRALGAPYCYWFIGGTDPAVYAAAEAAGRVAEDVPVNHSPFFAPVAQPTLDTGVEALVAGAMAHLGAGH
ncbi:amidohydrolase [Mariniluteicoccus flavus]